MATLLEYQRGNILREGFDRPCSTTHKTTPVGAPDLRNKATKEESAPIPVSISLGASRPVAVTFYREGSEQKEKPLRPNRSFRILNHVDWHSFPALLGAAPPDGYSATANLM